MTPTSCVSSRRATGVETGVLHWNIVLSGCVRAGELRTAEALLEELEARAPAGDPLDQVVRVDDHRPGMHVQHLQK